MPRKKMPIRRFFIKWLICVLALPSTVFAHYLWVSVDSSRDSDSADIFFEEGPRPGDGYYLDPFVKGGNTWVRTVEKIDPQKVPTTEKKEGKNRWLRAELSHPAPRSVESQGTFGVYRYGQTDVLLHYYAKYLDVDKHEDLHELSRAKHLKLDIVPHDDQDEVQLSVYWQGQPADGRQFYIRGPQGFRQNTKTDSSGKVTFKPSGGGQYTFRTYVELPDESGKFDGKDYQKVRHHATLTMMLPLKE